MNVFSADDTAVLSEDNKVQELRALVDKAREINSSDPSGTLVQMQEVVEHVRAWLARADSEALQNRLADILADALHIFARCHFAMADFRAVEQPASEALQLYIELNKESGQIDAYNTLGLLYWKVGKYDEALSQLFTVLALSQKNSDRPNESRILNNIGLVYDKLGDYPTALDYLLKSLEIDRALGNKKAVNRAMCNIGIIYSQLNDFQQALEHYQNCLEYEDSVDDKDGQSGSLNNIGVVYSRMGHHETALQYFRRCLDIRRAVNDQSGEALALCNIGDVYLSLGRYDEAMDALQTSLRLYRSQGNNDGMAQSLIGLSNMYRKLHESEQALECLKEALALAEMMGTKSMIYYVHEHLYKVYREIGDTARALEHHEQFHDIREHVHNEANNKRLAALQTLHQVEKTKKEAELYRVMNGELARANERLQVFNVEKNEMLGIVAHDLKNPLNSIRLISRMLYSDAGTIQGDEIREYATDIDTMVSSMFDFISNLLDINKIETQGITISNSACNISSIIQAVVDSHALHAHNKGISINFVVESCEGYGTTITTDSTLTRQIVDNLLSNAIKFSPFNSHINVRLAVGSTTWRVDVEDNGPGISEEDKRKLFTKFARLSARPTGNENSTGLGLSIVKKMAEALKGDIRCESTLGKGTLFIAEFPS